MHHAIRNNGKGFEATFWGDHPQGNCRFKFSKTFPSRDKMNQWIDEVKKKVFTSEAYKFLGEKL